MFAIGKQVPSTKSACSTRDAVQQEGDMVAVFDDRRPPHTVGPGICWRRFISEARAPCIRALWRITLQVGQETGAT